MTLVPLSTRVPAGARTIRPPLHAMRRRVPRPGGIARRRFLVQFTKRVLPVGALALLATIVLWPEISRDAERHRLGFRNIGGMPVNGQMDTATYHGIDERGRPYTMTAAAARESAPGRVELTEPKGDITMGSSGWVMVQSHKGSYLQHAGDLDLSGDVVLYRDDGMTLHTDTADVDLKAGAAASTDMTHTEGPFGHLDSQGFTLTDRGNLVRFPGPGHLVMRAAGR